MGDLTIEDVRWVWGTDIHIRPGITSRHLTSDVWLRFQTASKTLKQCADRVLSVTIVGSTALLESLPNPDWPDEVILSFNGEFEGAPNAHGVFVNAETGEVTAEKPRPAPIVAGTPPLRNFLLRVDVLAPGPITLVRVGPKRRIRVHIHDEVTDLWLTPDPLTLRVGQSFAQTVRGALQGPRLRLLAAFDDGTVGDLSDLETVQWTSDTTSVVSVAKDPVASSSQRTRFGFLHARDIGTARITATLPAEWGRRPDGTLWSASAKVDVKESWADLAKTTSMEQISYCIPNAAITPSVHVLFVPEGFLDGEDHRFAQQTERLVRYMFRSLSTQPFGYCQEKIRFWRAWITSRERGATNFSMVTESKSDGLGTLVGTKEPDPSSTDKFKGAELLYSVGLPTKDDAGVSFSKRLADWGTLYGAHVVPRIKETTAKKWLAASPPFYLGDQDTAFGLANGTPAQVEGDERILGLSPMRTQHADIDSFVQQLGLGTTGAWTKDDRVVIVTLVAGAPNSGTCDQEFISLAISGSDALESPAPDPAHPNRRSFKPHEIPKALSMEIRATAAHEIAHSFRIGDEYMELDDSLSGYEEILYSNLQMAPAAKDPIADVRWHNWPRIREAAVLASAPKQIGSTNRYEIPVLDGAGKLFKKDQVVRIRMRPVFDLDSMGSDDLTVQPDTTDDVVVVTWTPSGTGVIDPPDYDAGATLFLPRRNSKGDIECLVAEPIYDLILKENRPLELKTACDPTKPDDRKRQLPIGLPKLSFVPYRSARIIGLYTGGARHYCGIFHPAGACMMRSHMKKGNIWIHPFCQVCRYLLVDVLDPRQHRKIDDKYDDWYPRA